MVVGGDGGIFFRSSLAVIESAVAGWGVAGRGGSKCIHFTEIYSRM